jgi:hypothetical protein
MTTIGAAMTGLGLMLAAAATGSSSEVPTGVTVDPEVLQLREAAWRAWFAGDEAGLGRMLPPEFIGINMQAGPFSTRDETLEQAKAFRAGGGRLVRLEFPETRAQRYGDVVVLYGRYVAVMESEGIERTASGRLTEVFVRRDGRWLHPGWHLDTVAAP